MAKEKTYRHDDAFKARARAHQFAFREEVLGDFYDEKNPQVILSPGASGQGLIFCDTYRALIRDKVKTFGPSALFANMLRSEHIPYNLFIPMEEDLNGAAFLFNELIGGGVLRVTHIYIEFAGYADKGRYLDDGTSFDAFVEYEGADGGRGGIGIEVKYTERGYPVGVKEKCDIEDAMGRYSRITRECGYYKEGLDILMFVKAHHIRQIWRNHILGYAMIRNGDIRRFHHVHLYPQGNAHFHEYALPAYRKLLTEKGRASFVGLTYEELFAALSKYFTSAQQREWISYLYRRYIV